MDDLIIIFLIGLIGSMVGSFVSGTVSMMTISSLLAMGIPAHSALGIYRVGILGFRIGGLKEYLKSGNVIKSLVLPLTILGVIGASIGSLLVINVSQELLERIIAVVILIFIPLTLLNRNLGVVRQAVGKKRIAAGHVAYLAVSAWAGSFAIGTGIFATYIYFYLYGTTLLEARGTDKIPSGVLDIVVVTIFAFSGLIIWDIAVVFFIGMIIGTLLVTKHVINLGNKWLRVISLFAIGLLSLRLLFF